jgi:hypothetical protein
MTLPSVPAGQYALWVEGDGATQGDFTLRVTSAMPVATPTNDFCGQTTMPPTLSPASGQAGDTRGASNDDQGGCGFDYGENGEDAPDVVYHLVVSTMQTLTVSVTPDATTGTLFRPLVYVRAPNQCASTVTTTPTPLGCQVAPDFGQSASVTLNNLAPGTYNVWVDGAGLSSGGFTIKIQ